MSEIGKTVKPKRRVPFWVLAIAAVVVLGRIGGLLNDSQEPLIYRIFGFQPLNGSQAAGFDLEKLGENLLLAWVIYRLFTQRGNAAAEKT